MGKKNKSQSSLGRSLIKDRFSGNRKYVSDKSMVRSGFDVLIVSHNLNTMKLSRFSYILRKYKTGTIGAD